MYATCGSEKRYSKDNAFLGCNLMCKKADLPKIWVFLKPQLRFEKYSLNEHPLCFKTEFPKCHHKLYASVKVCSKEGSDNRGRVLVTCGDQAPNEQCDFYWGNNKLGVNVHVLWSPRECDFHWLRKNGLIQQEKNPLAE